VVTVRAAVVRRRIGRLLCVVTDGAGQKLLYVYFEEEPGRRSAADERALWLATDALSSHHVEYPVDDLAHRPRGPVAQGLGKCHAITRHAASVRSVWYIG